MADAGAPAATTRDAGPDGGRRARLIRAGLALEGVTLGWNVLGVAVLAVLAAGSGSTAIAGFGFDSLIEIGASVVVLWELTGAPDARRRRALRLIGVAFVLLALSLLVASGVALASGHRPDGSVGGIVWTAITAAVMFTLAALKARTGRALGDPVLETEGRVTFVDGVLAASVLIGVALNTVLGWWWADPLVGLLIVGYAVREALHLLRG